MAIADIFSLPSWREGLGVVYLEAMAHGKPVIACEGQGIAAVVEDNSTGLFVKPNDVETLARAMNSLLENPQRGHEIGERAKKLVLGSYTWEKNARRYIEIYEELLTHDG
jgi:glycosyltransferase involved in cell wall biosynthesis